MKSSMQDLFEEWYRLQFPHNADTLLKWQIELGYLDNTVNAMWIGFNAHAVLTDTVPSKA